MIEKKRGTRWLLVSLVACLSLVAAACGDDDDGGGNETGGGNGGGGGSVTVTGSSTVEPISSAAAEVFSEEAPDVQIDVEGPGTSDGFQKFCAGDADVTDASRPIRDSEIAECEAAGVEYVELKVAIDGIALMTQR